MKNSTKMLAVLAISIMALVACGGTGGNNDSVATSSEPQTTSKPVSTAKPVKKYNVTFDLNYPGAPEAEVQEVEKKHTATEPADPVRDGYAFLGWYDTADGEFLYEFDTIITDARTVYAHWGPAGTAKQKVYKFEAEYCPIITEGQGLQGATYSGGANGKALILAEKENDPWDCSNGFYVGFLYETGNKLVFDIVAEEACTATIYMRLSGEYRSDFTISPENYTINVNGTAINYDPVVFKDLTPQGGSNPFQDYVLTRDIALQKGKNTVEMITSNSEFHKGTAMATAPLIDCLKFYTTGNLSWPTANLDNIVSDSE